jgi:hypothetical protein
MWCFRLQVVDEIGLFAFAIVAEHVALNLVTLGQHNGQS